MRPFLLAGRYSLTLLKASINNDRTTVGRVSFTSRFTIEITSDIIGDGNRRLLRGKTMLTNNQKIKRALALIRETLTDIEEMMAEEAKKRKPKKKITVADRIRTLSKQGLTQMEIADELGLKQSAVSCIMSGFKEWKQAE